MTHAVIKLFLGLYGMWHRLVETTCRPYLPIYTKNWIIAAASNTLLPDQPRFRRRTIRTKTHWHVSHISFSTITLKFSESQIRLFPRLTNSHLVPEHNLIRKTFLKIESEELFFPFLIILTPFLLQRNSYLNFRTLYIYIYIHTRRLNIILFEKLF